MADKPSGDRCGRATFYVSWMEHSATAATGTAWEPTPWAAVQEGGVGGAEAVSYAPAPAPAATGPAREPG
jgi:hypothetical protein